MSGSPGNTSSGEKGGRGPRAGNADVVERHGKQGAGAGPATGTDAETSARGTRTGRNDSDAQDPDSSSDDDR